MKKKQEVIYYTDELQDEFSTTQITPRKIDASYDYGTKSFKWKLFHIFWYSIVFRPICRFTFKFILGHKIVNRKILKPYKNKPFFMYGNHTNTACDPFIPSMLAYRNHVFVIVHPNNVSMPVLGRINPYLGAIPLPDDLSAAKNFMNAIKVRIEQKRIVMIYPEAHIWPYYTKIRPFVETSFRYPVQYNVPVFCFTNTYQKRRFSSKPRIVTYVDGPFFADGNLSSKEQKKDLRDKVYNTMTEKSKNNTVEVIKYIKKETTNKEEI